eukprot:15340727-Ditylum_brightwellii.AAC.1
MELDAEGGHKIQVKFEWQIDPKLHLQRSINSDAWKTLTRYPVRDLFTKAFDVKQETIGCSPTK